MDQKQQNTKAHLVLGSLIEMEDTEESHIVKIMEVYNATITVAPWIVTHGLNTTMCTRIQSQILRGKCIYGLPIMTKGTLRYTRVPWKAGTRYWPCKHLGPQGMFRWLMITIIVTNEFVQLNRSLSLIWSYVKRGPSISVIQKKTISVFNLYMSRLRIFLVLSVTRLRRTLRLVYVL